jgi:hypothetical protein
METIKPGETCPLCGTVCEEPKELLHLNHYTTIPALLGMVCREKLTLPDPKNWKDKNDSELIEKYTAKKDCIVRVLCFTTVYDTVQHWETYASSGCRIDFDAPVLLDALSHVKGLRHGPVQYKTIEDVRAKIKEGTIKTEDLPFLKRIPYRYEEEYRIIWERKVLKKARKTKEISIDLGLIKGITISQDVPAPLYKTIKALLIKAGIPENHIRHTTLVRNSHWLAVFDKMLK